MADKIEAPSGADGKVASNVVPMPKREPAWKTKLYRTEGNRPKIKNVIPNGMVALRESPEWRGAIRFDENAQDIIIEKQPPSPWPQGTNLWVERSWLEQDDGLLSEWLTRQGIDLSPAGASEAALLVARESSFHPIRDYLNSLQWDGKSRTASWLFDYLGADNQGDAADYISAIGQKWLISAVARVTDPGCQVDHVLIFEGMQGNGKSSLLRELCPVESWFTDQSPDLKDAVEAPRSIEGKWIIELAELEAFKGVNHERLKAFITRRVDHLRRPWGRRYIDAKRQLIFAGSTNRTDYFNDETGNRRYWPFKATKLDIAGVKAVRDQLWAESVVLYKAKVPHWMDTPELRKLAADAQDRRFDVDPWEEEVEDFLYRMEGPTCASKDIFRVICPGEKMTTGDQRRIAKILRHLNFIPDQGRDANGKMRRFFKRIQD